LSEICIGHRLDKRIDESKVLDLNLLLAEWGAELKSIREYLKGKPLDAVTFPAFVMDAYSSGTEGDITAFESFLADLRGTAGNVELIGVDFQTDHLHGIVPEKLERYLRTVNSLVQKKGPTAGLQVVLTATNAMTSSQSPAIISLANSLGLLAVSTEVLRTHQRRPGLLTDVSNELRIAKIIEASRSAEKAPDASLDQIISEAVRQLNTSLNNCVYLENGFAEKVSF
jgi:hypothetical protein